MGDNNNNFNGIVYGENDKKARIKKEKVITNALSISIGIVVSVVVLYALYVVIQPSTETTTNSQYFTADQIKRLNEAAKIIDQDFLYDYDKDKMVDGAIEGMVNSLENVYTYYQTEEEYQEELNSGTNSTYFGIGTHLTYDKQTGGIRVIGTVTDSPAEKAGLLPGDIILKVDDLVINVDTYMDGVNAIRGEKGTSVHLTIARNKEAVELDVTRDEITENDITSEVIDNIGYIRIYSFGNGIHEQFKEAYDRIIGQNVQGLVIDLRNNPGGYVRNTVKMLDMIVGKGEILKLVDKHGKVESFNATTDEELNLPLAVIVNGGSASASEIFASVIKDTQKGKVFGTQTYGKGVVQYVRTIKGHGAIDIVAAQYFTPSGVEIQDNGIEPDEIVEVDKEYEKSSFIPREKDTQLQKALEYVKNNVK